MTSSSRFIGYSTGVVLAALLAILQPAVVVCGAVEESPQMPAAPDVLVLVICGLGASDLVSVNYNSVLAEGDVRRDIEAIGKECGWRVERMRITSKAAGGAGDRTTSGSFEVVSALDYAAGQLPVAAFVQALKRFRTIDLNFVVPDRFVFQGPTSYADRYVKLQWRKSGSAHYYRVVVGDSNFDRLVLTTPAVREQTPKQDISCDRPVLKYGVILLAAICCAVVVFYVGRSMSGARAGRNRGKDDGT